MSKRIYIDLDDMQIHARVAGKGQPVMLLHASPLSSFFMAGHIEKLQAKHQVLAVDTPGYGNSDPLPAPPKALEDYALKLLEAARKYGWDSFRLYGTATGAQIALCMAKLAPDRITKLVIDNCGHFDVGLRAMWEKDYFPELVAKPDGSHWQQAWDIAKAQSEYFPWHIKSGMTALNRPAPPPEIITRMAIGFIDSNPSYDIAYRLAFAAEDIASFVGLTVPTTLIDWQGSIVRAHVQMLIDKGLPPCVQLVSAGASPQDRLEAVAKAFG